LIIEKASLSFMLESWQRPGLFFEGAKVSLVTKSADDKRQMPVPEF
jgi:hypothetical protein